VCLHVASVVASTVVGRGNLWIGDKEEACMYCMLKAIRRTNG